MKLVLILLTALTALAAPVFAGTLRYAVFPAPPFIIYDGNDSAADIRGIDVDMARAVAERMDVRLEFIPCTWARALTLMRTGGVDLISSAYRTPEREEFMRYFETATVQQLPVAFYVRKGAGVRIDRFRDLYAVDSVGVLHGALYFTRFDYDPAIRKTVVNTQDQLFEMLLAGRFECVAGYIPRENYYLSRSPYFGKVERSHFVHNEYRPVFMALSRRSEFMSRFDEMNRITAQLSGEGTFKNIIEGYAREYSLPPDMFGSVSPTPPIPAP